MVSASTREKSVAATYVSLLKAGFHAACRASGCVQRDLVIGGRGLRLRFAGSALVEPLSGALAHAERRIPVPPVATALLWDAASTGVPLPPVQWRARDLDDYGRARGYRVRDWDGERVYTALNGLGCGTITVFDVDSRTGIYATTDAAAVTVYERAAPLRSFLHWALAERGRHLVHAGAVGGPDGGVLVAGRSGSGKSTLALSCVAAGLGYLGDDYVLIDVNAAPPIAHAVHATAKLDVDATVWPDTLTPRVLRREASDSAKVVLDMYRHRPMALLSSVPVRAVVLPRARPGSPTRVRAASAAEGVRAVAPSTTLQHFGHERSGLATVAELMRGVPVYTIELGSDMASAVGAVASLMRSSPS